MTRRKNRSQSDATRRVGPRREGFQVGPGTVAVLTYDLFDAEGELVEASDPSSPLVVLFGFGQAAPALEQGLSGAGAGEARDVVLSAEEAFGERDPHAIIEVAREELPPDVAPGDELSADREDGGSVALKVMEVLEDRVVLDTNHPLAGQKVRLRLRVEAVRPATDEEVRAATERIARATEGDPGPLLPAERLLRRGRGEPSPAGSAPPPPTQGG
jgi:FKBP-type peptidyl-prolyl cis-trans isomerase SlyD